MKKAFTLVELLVVAVITVLFCAMLPSAVSSADPAKDAACKNNLKQISAGIAMYTDTYGTQPINNYGWAPRGSSHSFLTSYGVLLSPYVDADYAAKGFSGTAKVKYRSKVFSCPFDTADYNFWANSYSPVNGNVMPQSAGTNHLQIPFAQMKNPAGTMAVMDGKAMQVKENDIRPGAFIKNIGLYNAAGEWKTDARSGASALKFDVNKNGIPDSAVEKAPFNGADLRHDAKIMSSFCDGHVAVLNEEAWSNPANWGWLVSAK